MRKSPQMHFFSWVCRIRNNNFKLVDHDSKTMIKIAVKTLKLYIKTHFKITLKFKNLIFLMLQCASFLVTPNIYHVQVCGNTDENSKTKQSKNIACILNGTRNHYMNNCRNKNICLLLECRNRSLLCGIWPENKMKMSATIHSGMDILWWRNQARIVIEYHRKKNLDPVF